MTAGAALGLDASRAADPAQFAIGGTPPRLAVRPADRTELCEVLAAASRDGLSIVPWGGGVSAGHDAALPRYDLAIDLTGLDRIVEHQRDDLSLTAECGATISTLRSTLAEHGQELPLEAAHAGRATLGGVLAANASGTRRMRFGAPRDRVVGATFALADGTLARAGGKVVKSVAGYATHRLLCGSRGGLAIIVEASLKLIPAPVVRRALVFDADAEAIADAQRWASLARLEPAVLTILGRDASRAAGLTPRAFAVIAGLEDDAPWVERQATALTERLGAPAQRLDGDEANALWQSLADLEEQPGNRATFTTAGNTPAAISAWLESEVRDRLVFHATAGRLHCFATDAESLADTRPGFTCIGSRGAPPLTDPADSATTLLRARIRAAMDPGQRMAWGERWARGQA